MASPPTDSPIPPSLPVIDLSKWTSPSSSAIDRLSMAHKLVQACHETGFVYIINHGILKDHLNEVFAMSKKFFALPFEKRMEAKYVEGANAFRGYAWPGKLSGSSFYDADHPDATRIESGKETKSGDLTESYDIGSDECPDDANVWLPDSTLPGLRALVTEFYGECWKTSKAILQALALGLGFDDEDFLLQFHSGHDNEVSLRHYPAVPEHVLADQKVERLGAHTDLDCFTLLFQDNVGGLEVQKSGKPGEFLQVEPIEGALIMNIGDVLMHWSNDYLISTIHRVNLPPLQDRYTGEERMTQERFSIPYFVAPKRNIMLECLPHTCSEEKPKHEPVPLKDWYAERISRFFDS